MHTDCRGVGGRGTEGESQNQRRRPKLDMKVRFRGRILIIEELEVGEPEVKARIGCALASPG
jgi:hypothetical protein